MDQSIALGEEQTDVREAPAATVDMRMLIDLAIRDALGLPVNDPRRGHDVRARLRPACCAARDSDLRVEQLIVLVKEQWRKLPEARARLRPDGAEVLAHVITICVDEYYADAVSETR